MRTAALLYAGSLTGQALLPLAGGGTAYERVRSFAATLPGLSGSLVLGGALALPELGLPSLSRPVWDVPGLLEEAGRFVAGLEADGGGEVDALVLMTADELFLDAELSSRLLDDFRRYRADYAFADGYPVGLAVEVLHPRILPALAALAAKHPTGLERGWLFRLIQKDINAFDIETLISPRDMRDLRLELACDTRRNTLLCERLLKAGVVDTETALALIPENLGLLRTLPAFIQVQVSGGCPQACLLCPWPLVGGDILSRRDFMPRRLFSRLMEAVSAFCGDAVIDLSLWGEPSLHPDIEGLVEEVLGRPGLSLILETSGLGWKPGSFERLAARWGGRIDWVVSLDASTPELYAKLRGEGFEEAVATARRLIALFPGTAHVQTVRAFDNEALLEEFWRGWKKETDNVIVQKYSTFAGFLPERRVTDLSPLHRRPCWHLKRDLSILIDGTVPLCRECVRSELLLGRLFEKGEEETIEASLLGARLAAVWEAGEEAHRRHIAASYPSPCEACDEYYTYNA